MRKLYIKCSGSDELPSLREIVSCTKDLHWSVLNASGILNFNTLPSDWLEIQDLDRGLFLSSEELSQFDVSLEEGATCLMDAIILGASNSDNLRRYKSEIEMETNCELVLDLADGASWLISSSDTELLNLMAAKFQSYAPQFVDEIWREK